MGLFDILSAAKDTKQSSNSQRGSEKSKGGSAPGKPASQSSPYGPAKDKGSDKKSK